MLYGHGQLPNVASKCLNSELETDIDYYFVPHFLHMASERRKV